MRSVSGSRVAMRKSALISTTENLTGSNFGRQMNESCGRGEACGRAPAFQCSLFRRRRLLHVASRAAPRLFADSLCLQHRVSQPLVAAAAVAAVVVAVPTPPTLVRSAAEVLFSAAALHGA